MTQILKPCPFCGSGEPYVYERTCDRGSPYDPTDRAFPIVRCRGCYAEVPGKDWTSSKTAIAAWNTRHSDPDELREAHPLTLSEIAEQQFDEAIKASFRHGAQAMREMLARFVENSPPTDLGAMAGSMRANWYPAWGDDPGQTSELPRNALGDTDERDERHSRFAARAVEHAMSLLDADDARTALSRNVGDAP